MDNYHELTGPAGPMKVSCQSLRLWVFSLKLGQGSPPRPPPQPPFRVQLEGRRAGARANGGVGRGGGDPEGGRQRLGEGCDLGGVLQVLKGFGYPHPPQKVAGHEIGAGSWEDEGNEIGDPTTLPQKVAGIFGSFAPKDNHVAMNSMNVESPIA